MGQREREKGWGERRGVNCSHWSERKWKGNFLCVLCWAPWEGEKKLLSTQWTWGGWSRQTGDVHRERMYVLWVSACEREGEREREGGSDELCRTSMTSSSSSETLTYLFSCLFSILRSHSRTCSCHVKQTM